MTSTIPTFTTNFDEIDRVFLDKYPQSEPLGVRTPESVPWTIIPDVPAVVGEYALTEEAFCRRLAQVSIYP